MKKIFGKIKYLFRCFRISIISLLTLRAGKIKLEPSLILAPHPDDETFGCGEMVAALRESGKDVYIIYLTDGTASHQNCCNISQDLLGSTRSSKAKFVAAFFGVPEENLFFCHLPDGNLSKTLPLKYKDLQHLTETLHCKRIFAPHPQEGWPDHLAVTNLGIYLASHLNMELFYYCIWFYFSMPFKKFKEVSWGRSKHLYSETAYKRKCTAIDLYTRDFAPCGQPYIGKLPKELLSTIKFRREIYFEHEA